MFLVFYFFLYIIMNDDKAPDTNYTIFQTRDIGLAAYLKLQGYELKTSEKQWGRVLFGFIDTDRKKREQDVYDFYNDVGSFLSYTDAWKNLKSFLYNMPNNDDNSNR